MKLYTLKQDPTSRYAKMQECKSGEFVKVSDVKEMIDEMIELKMISDQYDILVKHGLITELL